MNIELDVDIAALVGEIEAPPCEHSMHGTNRLHDAGAATHYLQSFCDDCGKEPIVYPACATWVAFVNADGPLKCSSCNEHKPASEGVRVLGPVNK